MYPTMSAQRKDVCDHLDEFNKSQKYAKAVSINIDIGAEALRESIHEKLDPSGIDLQQHISLPANQNVISRLRRHKRLFTQQLALLQSPNTDDMDVSLLSLVLLEMFVLDTVEKQCIEDLRNKRNAISHLPKCRLENDDIFNDTKKIIFDLSKCLSTDAKNRIRSNIMHLEQRGPICTALHLNIVRLHNEQLMMRMLELLDSGDSDHLQLLRFGLTSFVRHIARFLDVEELLHELKKEQVIQEVVRIDILRDSDSEEQISKLVLYILNETNENLLKCCSCIRKLKPSLADLIEYTNDDGKKTVKELRRLEEDAIKDILTKSLEKDQLKSVSTEEVHIYVEARRGYTTDFSTIRKHVLSIFDGISNEDNDCRFIGIGWKDNVDMFDSTPIDVKAVPIHKGNGGKASKHAGPSIC